MKEGQTFKPVVKNKTNLANGRGPEVAGIERESARQASLAWGSAKPPSNEAGADARSDEYHFIFHAFRLGHMLVVDCRSSLNSPPHEVMEAYIHCCHISVSPRHSPLKCEQR